MADYNSFTTIAIVNTGSTIATINSVQFFTQTGGTAIVTVPGFTLNPGASYFINTRGGGDVPFATMQALSEKFYGSAVVNAAAGAKLKAVRHSTGAALPQIIQRNQPVSSPARHDICRRLVKQRTAMAVRCFSRIRDILCGPQLTRDYSSSLRTASGACTA